MLCVKFMMFIHSLEFKWGFITFYPLKNKGVIIGNINLEGSCCSYGSMKMAEEGRRGADLVSGE